MRPPERFETRRLVLRVPRRTDAQDIFDGYATDPEVPRYMTWRPHTSIDMTRAFLEECIAEWACEGSFNWAITMRDVDRCIGMVSLRISGPKAELGYALARDNWGQGIMSEAVQALVDWALDQPEIFRVWAVCDVENAASARVMEKVGMAREGILRRWMWHPNMGGEPRDCLCYSKVK
jgi:RimJ/RimL family protein N-acetyltransferase